jgi:hypothetical protein
LGNCDADERGNTIGIIKKEKAARNFFFKYLFLILLAIYNFEINKKTKKYESNKFEECTYNSN